ncbi:MAG: PHP domain-containing protein, partial [bacterium]
RRAAISIITLDAPVEEYAGNGELLRIRWVGPFVARVVGEILSGARPPFPPTGEWPEAARSAYELVAPGYDTFLALHDARRFAQQRGLPAARGDLQNHTTWSDGVASPRTVVRAAENLRYDYIAITDHSAGLRIARGMPVEKMRRQHAALQRLSARLGFRVFRGVEVNVLPSGDLDLSAADLEGVELVVASCHSHLRRTEDQTARLIAAVTHPAVHILGHPRGRIFGVPRGINADWDAVFAAAARHNTAIEINSSPDRQDIDFALAARAGEAGCWISLGTDSHSIRELVWLDIARGHLALSGAPADRVLNFLSAPDLASWLRQKVALNIDARL